MRGSKVLVIIMLMLALIGIASANSLCEWVENRASDFNDGQFYNTEIYDNSVRLKFGFTSGWYESNLQDTGEPRYFSDLKFEGSEPTGTNVEVQIKTILDGYDTGYRGPDFSTTTYYQMEGGWQNIPHDHDGRSKIQYKVYFTASSDNGPRPKLNKITIRYNCSPAPPVPEPATWMLLSVGLIGLIGLARIRR